MAEQKFTPRAENVLRLAQETALELGRGYVGCEHILLGLLREDGSAACRALGEAGVTEEQLREQLVRTVGHGLSGSLPSQGLTPRARSAVEMAVAEAMRFASPRIGTEHLLLGLLRDGGNMAVRGGRPEAPLRRGGAADQRNAAHGGKGGKPDAA